MKHKFKKKFGQNFINDTNLLQKIVSLAELKKNDNVIEIGVGSGNLTEQLVKTGARVTAYEIDLDLKEHLIDKFGNKVNFIFEDFMTRDIKKDLSNNGYKLVANLPYYITTPIIMKIIESDLQIDKMILMVQKEVADRFKASNKTKDYNALSVVLQYYYDIKEEIKVNRKVFFPVPNVDSSVISMTIRKNLPNIDEKLFIKFIKEVFSQKRKTLKNNMKSYDFENILPDLLKLGYSETVRAEEISVQDFVYIFNELSKTPINVDKKA